MDPRLPVQQRTTRKLCRNTFSLEKITHRVPQGSILGPMLFIILVNDIQNRLFHCLMLMYVDDTVLLYSAKKINDTENVINNEVELIKTWIKENCLILNLNKVKTEFLLYGSKLNVNKCSIQINNKEIHQPTSYEYLGITLDHHLNLSEHYNKVYKKICTRIKLLGKIRYELSPPVAEKIYNTNIKPIFLYCTTIHCGQSNTWIGRFESLQNRAKSIVGRNASNWPFIQSERKRKISLDVFKIVHEIDQISTVNYEITNYGLSTTGNKSTIKLPKITTEAGRKTTYYQGAMVFNNLPAKVRNEKYFSNFKRLIKKHDF